MIRRLVDLFKCMDSLRSREIIGFYDMGYLYELDCFNVLNILNVLCVNYI